MDSEVSLALANTAIPLSGVPELLGAAAFLLGLLGVAVALTFSPRLAPHRPFSRALLVALARAGP